MTPASSSNRLRQARTERTSKTSPSALARDHSRAASHSCLPLQGVVDFIDVHLGDQLSLAKLAALGGLSIWRFATVFRTFTGEPPQRYVLHRRIERAQLMLRQGMSPSRVALETGFYDQSHLYRHFKRHCGMTPGQYAGLAEAGARKPGDPS